MTNINDRLETDWDSFKELWADVTKFMKEHPTHVIIPADSNGRCGWMAFIETTSLNIEDEQAKEWTIPVSSFLKEDPKINKNLSTSEGRLKMCRELCEGRWK